MFRFAVLLLSFVALAESVPRCTKSILDWWKSDVAPGARAFVVDTSQIGISWHCLVKKNDNSSDILDPVVFSHSDLGTFQQESKMPCKFIKDYFGAAASMANATLPGAAAGTCASPSRAGTSCSYPGASSGQTTWGGPTWKASPYSL